MKRQGGFTLIEMIVVIVILGILAVTAAPKFLSFQDDAREAALSGLKGAMASAASITYGKASIEGVETSSSEVTVGTVKTKFGYPIAATGGIDAAVEGLDANSADWKEILPAVAGVAKFTFKDASTDLASKCFVTYTEATASVPAKVVVNSACNS
ncbi:type II secretion system protein [Enterovibrio baiacu]|uniref:type II secretion system protein n=1 Tax=Enterovibrio baiacu TaxID=2491023 RepID=UPI003D0E56EC